MTTIDTAGTTKRRSPTLRGVGLVPGVAGGEAWLGSAGSARRAGGERILVCDTLPAWALDVLPAAVVCEQPVSTVAPGLDALRRQGFPVVGGVAGARRLIRSGQAIVVDGTGGRVWANALLVPAGSSTE
jgi:phosphohistidine swiveling domain-containing protein